jgi:hypothetical protein
MAGKGDSGESPGGSGWNDGEDLGRGGVTEGPKKVSIVVGAGVDDEIEVFHANVER